MFDYFLRSPASLPGRETKRKQVRVLASIGDKASGKNGGAARRAMGSFASLRRYSPLTVPVLRRGECLALRQNSPSRKNQSNINRA
ncbi:hypothetical protein [Chitinilyticum litopenaei]|uniref:hypothetical protein n=1 Tax=Chitinilyticum litopenaei TaxID=1121276 RepID=UPI0011856EC1|nr:hypothetical protein [Chitinilyticum litopenaei]